MKISNLFLTLTLVLFASFVLHGQSNSKHVISINNDDGFIHIEFEDGEVTTLKIDGELIKKSDYSSYQDIIEQNKPRSESHQINSHKTVRKNDMQAILLEKLADYLSKGDDFNSSKFELKLTPRYIKLNGKKLSRDKLNDCLEIFDKTAGYSLSEGSYFKVEISPKSRSVSLSIQD